MFTFRGTVPYDNDLDAAHIAQHIARRLREEQDYTAKAHLHGIRFKAKPWRLSSRCDRYWPFQNGDIALDEIKRLIRYRVSFGTWVASVTICITVVGLFTFAFPARRADLIWMLPVMWISLVGGNLMFGFFRLRSFLRRTVNEAKLELENSAAAS